MRSMSNTQNKGIAILTSLPLVADLAYSAVLSARDAINASFATPFAVILRHKRAKLDEDMMHYATNGMHMRSYSSC